MRTLIRIAIAVLLCVLIPLQSMAAATSFPVAPGLYSDDNPELTEEEMKQRRNRRRVVIITLVVVLFLSAGFLYWAAGEWLRGWSGSGIR